MVVMEAMAVTAVAFMDTARGPLMPMPTTAMVVMEAMAAMAPMVDTARGPLMPRLTTVLDTAMAVTAVVFTDTARGPLMPMPTTAMAVMAVTAVDMDTAMAAMAMVATPTASNFVQVCNNILIPNCHSNHLKTSSYNGGVVVWRRRWWTVSMLRW